MVCPCRSTLLTLFSLFFILFLTFFSPLNSFSDGVRGEIINVNYKYKIAFTDLTEEHLKKGDIVGIYKDGELLAYMQVVSSNSVISKLLWEPKMGSYINSGDFSKVNIGDIVVRLQDQGDKIIGGKTKFSLDNVIKPEGETISQVVSNNDIKQGHITEVCNGTKELNKQFKELSSNYANLSETLKEIMEEKKRLDLENKGLRQKLVEDERDIKVLKQQELTCKTQLINLRAQLASANCDQNNQKIKELKSILLKLRQRIKYLERILSGE